ncbi:LOW QUALITY PROTEIN: E3 ubiquitin-protein ligase RNF144B-like [Brachypodium distachyon]|uniref:LOW QUALITY PROTEIN: E3 ubiquitin-protein ligase RNF144B-like n=1 Tax=Brachypodium distachyon TaxID=15368 RepID=UPI000234F879|nr:LOW QUALITY PROTEIN: E3 ubiquitin-protein ligase RNF144B-like [Brachypodium distachyon]|eukprot:XP_003572260.1 LOW QUALITY PROTEIN: E3 ubiquitin-protein ligase RNF144B-like [Brachypodium distachyon]
MADAAACSICMEPMAPTESHRGGSGCAHAFCGACLSGHVRAKVDAGAGAAVRCPDASCAGALDPELCHGTLPADLFVRWCAALCESMFLGARRTYYLFRDCSEMMVADDEDEGSEDCVTQTECQVCRRLFCARCGVPWHAGVSCGEFQRLDVGSARRRTLLLMETARECKWKRCPRCRFYVEKAVGCLHIVCRCGFEFCYGCGKPWALIHDGCPGE